MTFNDLCRLSTTVKGTKEIDVNMTLDINGQRWKAYQVYVAHRDLLFLCDKGTATYLVDSYGERHTAELFDWHENEQ